ncbi:MAG: TolC family protein [Oligoflexia bacterium]|nr:TolC family protein [Oligoflexia bacterium]
MKKSCILRTSLAVVLVPLIIFVSPPIFAQSSTKVSFEELPKLIQERNNHYKGARKFLEASGQKTGHLVRSYLPTLKAEVGGETFKRGTHSEMSQPYGAIGANINLFRGGKDKLEDDILDKNLELSKSETESIYEVELAKARRAFWNLVYQKELLRILKAAEEQNQMNLEAAVRRIKAGAATETDRLDFEMESTKFEQDIARLNLGIKNSMRELKVLIGLSETSQLETPEQIPHQHEDQLLKMSVNAQNLREVRSLIANQEISENKKSQYYRWWVPNIDLYGAYGLHTFREIENVDQQNRKETVFGIKLTLDIFDGFQSKVAGSAHSLEAEGFRLEANQVSKELKARIDGAQDELKLTHDLIHSAEKILEQGKKYLQRTLSEYSRGVKNSPDVLGANQRFIEYQRRAIELKKDYQLAKTDLLAVLGQ